MVKQIEISETTIWSAKKLCKFINVFVRLRLYVVLLMSLCSKHVSNDSLVKPRIMDVLITNPIPGY